MFGLRSVPQPGSARFSPPTRSPEQPPQSDWRHTVDVSSHCCCLFTLYSPLSVSAQWCVWWQGAPGGRRIGWRRREKKSSFLNSLPSAHSEKVHRGKESESDRDCSRRSSFTEKWRSAVFSLFHSCLLLFPLLVSPLLLFPFILLSSSSACRQLDFSQVHLWQMPKWCWPISDWQLWVCLRRDNGMKWQFANTKWRIMKRLTYQSNRDWRVFLHQTRVFLDQQSCQLWLTDGFSNHLPSGVFFWKNTVLLHRTVWCVRLHLYRPRWNLKSWRHHAPRANSIALHLSLQQLPCFIHVHHQK